MRDRHGHPAHFCGGGFLGGGPASSGWADRHDPLGLRGLVAAWARKTRFIEATGNAMAVVRVLSRYVARVIVANPVQVKAIAHAHVNRRFGCPMRKPSSGAGWWLAG